MSDEFNYLSLNQNNDQKEPLISDNPIKENDSSNFVENLKTLSHCETKVIDEEQINNNNANLKFQQYSSVTTNLPTPKKTQKNSENNKTMQSGN
jgi:hypothetical protein